MKMQANTKPPLIHHPLKLLFLIFKQLTWTFKSKLEVLRFANENLLLGSIRQLMFCLDFKFEFKLSTAHEFIESYLLLTSKVKRLLYLYLLEILSLPSLVRHQYFEDQYLMLHQVTFHRSTQHLVHRKEAQSCKVQQYKLKHLNATFKLILLKTCQMLNYIDLHLILALKYLYYT